jgi:hypothetical protein
MRAYILSRTTMNNGRFCTCVAVQVNGTWHQYRLMNQGGYSMTFSDTPFTQKEVEEGWNVGVAIDIGIVLKAKPRQTHPEDLRIDPKSMKFTGRTLKDEHLSQAIDSLAFDNIEGLYPTINTGRYVHEASLSRSVGYVRSANVVIDGHSKRADISDTSGRTLWNVPIVGTELRKRHSGRFEYSDCTVRLSLANPWDGQSRENEPRRCYIQLSDVIA